MFRFHIRDLAWLTLVVALSIVVVRDRWSASASSLALDGYCPVTLIEARQWQRGDSRWETTLEGQTYFFASGSKRQLFLAAPEKYAPVCNGNDAVRLVDEKRTSAGLRRHGLTYDAHIYLFDSEESLSRFAANPAKYLQH